jgi:hypothetical protein
MMLLLSATLATLRIGAFGLANDALLLTHPEWSVIHPNWSSSLPRWRLRHYSIPCRRRVQNVIDRRFYRRKYDAAQTLAACSTTMRDETDLDKLTEALVAVVEETMQPAHVSLWLRKPERKA